MPCRCGARLSLFSSKEEGTDCSTTYWYLCPRCATHVETRVVRLPDGPGQELPRWDTTIIEHPPPAEFNPDAKSATEAPGDMACYCGATLEIIAEQEIGPVTVFGLKCPR
jgi:hypothetical protein